MPSAFSYIFKQQIILKCWNLPWEENSIFEQLYFCAFKFSATTLELRRGRTCNEDGIIQWRLYYSGCTGWLVKAAGPSSLTLHYVGGTTLSRLPPDEEPSVLQFCARQLPEACAGTLNTSTLLHWLFSSFYQFGLPVVKLYILIWILWLKSNCSEKSLPGWTKG